MTPPLHSRPDECPAKRHSVGRLVGRCFVTKAEATYRFGFVADAKDIPKWRAKRWPLPKNFRPAVRTDCGEIIEAKYGERYHAEIISRIGEDAQEGYVYDPANNPVRHDGAQPRSCL